MRKLLTVVPTQISFWTLMYQVSTGISWRIALASVPFTILATLTGISWWKGLKAFYDKRWGKKREGESRMAPEKPAS